MPQFGHFVKVEKAIEEDNPGKIEKAAHSIKGMSGHLHTEEITRIASEIEGISAEGSMKGIAEKLSQLKGHFAELESMIGSGYARRAERA